MTIVRESRDPWLSDVHSLAVKASGETFADKLCDDIENAQAMLRLRVADRHRRSTAPATPEARRQALSERAQLVQALDHAELDRDDAQAVELASRLAEVDRTIKATDPALFPDVRPAQQRKEAGRIFDAAHELLDALWQASPETRRHLFEGRKPLLTTMDDGLAELLNLTEQHVRDLPATQAPDYLRLAIVGKLRAVFDEHEVSFTQTGYTSEGSRNRDGKEYTSLAVCAVSVALADPLTRKPLTKAAAKTAIRDYAKRS